MQQNLFSNNETFELAGNARLELRRQWCVDHAELFQQLSTLPDLKQETLLMGGKEVLTPRLQAWYGDPGAAMRYSGARFNPKPIPAFLYPIKNQLQIECGVDFNSVLVNCYRNEEDGVGWHADDEHELGVNPFIASLSLGESRRFSIRPNLERLANTNPINSVSSGLKPLNNKALDLQLSSGDLLLMSGGLQRFWQHRVPKESKNCSERINLTFRWVQN
ncbi:MAG: alkylated DNA repair dioxygenase AlkB [Flavobacteriales bacterium]|jgi:alkylated DNA repair dioxygenase AlkB